MKGFTAKRLTFSNEALDMAEKLRKAASFRSLSETLEEVIRIIDSIDGLPTELANIRLARLGIALEVDKPNESSQ